jgi:hypothetical protein
MGIPEAKIRVVHNAPLQSPRLPALSSIVSIEHPTLVTVCGIVPSEGNCGPHFSIRAGRPGDSRMHTSTWLGMALRDVFSSSKPMPATVEIAYTSKASTIFPVVHASGGDLCSGVSTRSFRPGPCGGKASRLRHQLAFSRIPMSKLILPHPNRATKPHS